MLQLTNQWSTLQQIPNYEDTARPPLLVTDRERNVHVFNYESLGGLQNAIFYRRWNSESGWSPPADIILVGMGGGPQTLQGAVLDDQQMLHIIFYIGTDTGGNLYYAFAPAATANNASAWSHPRIIGQNAGPLPFASISIDGQGNFFVFYGSELEGNGLYMVRSEDHGQSWTQPLAMYMIPQDNQWPAAIRSIVGPDGMVHIVWSNVSNLGVGEAVHYARLNAQKNGFEVESILARREGNDYSATWPDIIHDGTKLLLFFQDSFPATRFLSISTDNGDTWSQPVRPFPYIGEYEFTAMSKDSNGTIHLVLGNRTTNPEIHGMWYSRWLGTRWSALEPITSGPVTSVYDPSAPQAVVLQGNILFTAWWNNVQRDKLSGAWYSYRLLDSPELEIIPNPTPTPEIIEVNQTSPTAIAESSPPASPTTVPEVFQTAPSSYLPAFSIFLGFIPAVLLIMIYYSVKKKQG